VQHTFVSDAQLVQGSDMAFQDRRCVRLYSRKAACKQKPFRLKDEFMESFDKLASFPKKVPLQLSLLLAMFMVALVSPGNERA
jgi:hypothetical protein